MDEFYQESAAMANKKKIAIVVCAYPPQGGGLGNNAYYQARELARLGYEAAVFTPEYALSEQGANTKIAQGLGFKLFYLPLWFKLGMAGFMFSLFGQLKRYEIVHLYYPFFGTDLIVWFYKIWHRQTKLVLHYQMDPVGRGWQKIFFWLYIKLFLGLIIGASDKIIVLSSDHAKNTYLNRYLNRYNKFAVVPNGVDTKIFRPQDKNQALQQKCGLKENEPVLIFVGGLDRQHYFKGLEILLESLKNISAKLLILGDGNLKKHYQDLAANFGVSEKAIFAGWIKNEELPAYYSLADVFILPSTARTESFGIVTAEAQACGIPAVVANWPGARETIKDGKTGFIVKPGDAADLTDKIVKLLSNLELRKEMGTAAADRAKELYAWDKAAGAINNLYKGL